MTNNIIYEDNHIIVCFKEEAILSQKDSSEKIDILSLLKEYLKVKYNKQGNIFLGLVHRLDLRVSGVMVFAKTSKAASRLSLSIREHLFTKIYHAIVRGKIDKPNTLIHNLNKENMVSVEDSSGKKCILEYFPLECYRMDNSYYTVIEINLITGRFNQIRKQLSLDNHPIINDFKYGYKGINYNDSLALIAKSISFPHPITKEICNFYVSDVDYNKWLKQFRKG